MRVKLLVFVVCLAAVGACGDNNSAPVDAGPDGPPKPACSDNVDNDGDGKVDYPYDPGCMVPQVDDEGDACPNGVGCPQCADTTDNDGNGESDFGTDPGCNSAADPIEFTDDPNACGQGTAIKQLPLNGQDMGALLGTTTSVTSPCGGGGGMPGIAYVFHVLRPTVIVASTDDPMTMIDTVLDLRTSMCTAPGSEVACHDDLATAVNKRSSLTKPLGIGTYYLFVNGKTAADAGAYALRVQFFPGAGSQCMIDTDCGPELVCRIPSGETTMMCAGPVCNDGRDDDADGKTDFPIDPGCTSTTDTTENDTCSTSPTDPMCPACANGVDDDADGTIDYPADPSCISASVTSEACLQSEGVIVATGPTTMGTTAGAVNDYTPPPGSVNNHLCSTTTGHTAPDRVVQLDLPAMKMLDLRLNPVGYDSTHVLLGPSCAGMPIDCSDNPNSMNVMNLAAGRYYLVVDGYSTGSGTFTLNIQGKIMPGESCEMPLATSGAITCQDGYTCGGTMGSRTCIPSACNDGIDNNSDGRMDYPADPGCVDSSDATENTVCPGATCPACADGVDNDNDTKIDYPMDTSCISASATNEACQQSEPIPTITQKITTGTTVGQTNDSTPTCGSTSHNAPDLAYQLDVPALATLSLDLTGFDGAHSLLDSSCGGTPLACSDPNVLTRTNVAAGRYYVIVDAWGTGSGAFTLTTTGTVAGGGSCEGSMFQSGAFTCASGYACSGTPGSRTCMPAACNDTQDNDGDGKMDYPADPGCTSRNDGSEADDCSPTVGPSCPVCSNGMDDDMDMLTDYPADTRCVSASFFVENFCPVDQNVAGMIAAPATQSTLANAANDYTQACQSTTGNDVSFGLRLPVAVASLQIDTIGSVASDTVVSLWNVTCTTSLGCDDDGDPASLRSLLTVANVPAGDYAIQVDGYSTTNNTDITVNVRGVVATGTACTSELFTAGVLVCPSGTTCTAGTCQ